MEEDVMVTAVLLFLVALFAAKYVGNKFVFKGQ